MTPSFQQFLAQIALRTAVTFIGLVLGFRLLGKRQLGQMHLMDLVMVMCVANAVQNGLTAGTGDLSTGFVSAGVLLLLGRLYTSLALRSSTFHAIASGHPVVILTDGKLRRDIAQAEGITMEQIEAALRQHGLTSPSQARLMVLEVDGSISVVPKDPLP
ncbi:MAG: DUF421 domain-containing protein [Chthonomonadales bacterium]